MTVRVDELTTDVSIESESGSSADAAGGSPQHWEQVASVRALQERVIRDAERTRAEAYGD